MRSEAASTAGMAEVPGQASWQPNSFLHQRDGHGVVYKHQDFVFKLLSLDLDFGGQVILADADALIQIHLVSIRSKPGSNVL